MEKNEFPCKNCIIKLQCVKPCNKIMINRIYEFFIENGVCPDCEGDTFASTFARIPVVDVNYSFQCLECETIFHVYYERFDTNPDWVYPMIKRVIKNKDKFSRMHKDVPGVELAKVLKNNFTRK